MIRPESFSLWPETACILILFPFYGVQHSSSKRRTSSGTSQRGPAGNVYEVFEKSDGSPAKKIKPDPFPEVQRVTMRVLINSDILVTPILVKLKEYFT